MLELDVLPANHGDCLIVSYGADTPHHILIDGGPANSYEQGLYRHLAERPALRRFELMVLTHVDTDHVDGAICLLRDAHAANGGRLGDLAINEVWMNGWAQLSADNQERGAIQGEYFGMLSVELGLTVNGAFRQEAAFRNIGQQICLPGGATVTVLTPAKRELDRMRDEWQAACRLAGFEPGSQQAVNDRLADRQMYAVESRGETGDAEVPRPKRPGSDSSRANGSSIGMLFEYGGRRLLLAGDAHARTMEESIARYRQRWGVERLHLDLFKLSHHGSVANLTPALLDMIDCNEFVVSTNGDRFGHPDVEALQLIVDNDARRGRGQSIIHFNYPERITPEIRGLNLDCRWTPKVSWPTP